MRRKKLIARKSRPKVRKAVKRVNVARKAREWARAYGSPERVAWMQGLKCAICQNPGPCQVAHIPSNAGAGRKGDASATIPLCPTCHRFQHAKGWGLLLAMTNPRPYLTILAEAHYNTWLMRSR